MCACVCVGAYVSDYIIFSSASCDSCRLLCLMHAFSHGKSVGCIIDGSLV